MVIVLDCRFGVAVPQRDDLRLEISRQSQITSHGRNLRAWQAFAQCRTIRRREKDRGHLLDADQVTQGVEALPGAPRRLPKRLQTDGRDFGPLLRRERGFSRAKDQGTLKAPPTESIALRFDPLAEVNVMHANGVQGQTNDAARVLGLHPTRLV